MERPRLPSANWAALLLSFDLSLDARRRITDGQIREVAA
jgi:hypothetical protein